MCTYIYLRICLTVAHTSRRVPLRRLSHATKRFVSVHLSRSSSAASTPPASNCVGNSIAAKLSRHYAQIVPRASALVNRGLTRVSSISIEGPFNFRSHSCASPRRFFHIIQSQVTNHAENQRLWVKNYAIMCKLSYRAWRHVFYTCPPSVTRYILNNDTLKNMILFF